MSECSESVREGGTGEGEGDEKGGREGVLQVH